MRGTFFYSACLLESSSVHCNEGSGRRWCDDVWIWIHNIYMWLCLYILIVLRVQQDHTPRSKFRLIQHCWYWYCKYCIYSCIINQYIFIIHVPYICAREGKWFVHILKLVLVGQSLSLSTLNLLWKLKHFNKVLSFCKSGSIDWLTDHSYPCEESISQ